MQIVLQDQASGLFVGEESQWVARSQLAQKFSSCAQAECFAKAQHVPRKVRMVARIEENKHAILLPFTATGIFDEFSKKEHL